MSDVVNLDGIPVKDLTEAKVNGDGVFDVMMRAVASHIKEEYGQGRIKGGDYAATYLGAMESASKVSLDFLLQRKRSLLDAQLVAVQIELAQIQKEQAAVEVEKARVELQILQQNATKIPWEIDLLKAQASLTNQQAINAVTEGKVLEGQVCKLKAEYDLTLQQVVRSQAETALLEQKLKTEAAQTNATGVDPNSILGRQATLYKAQTDGFTRDAEQKAIKILVDTWNVRRTTDESTVADATNKLDDATIGKGIQKLLGGVGVVV